jgi:uncharacterized protein
MAAPSNLIIFGASTRAAAFSAIRAGLRPWCGDLFADADLQPRCPVTALSPERFADGFDSLADSAPEGPWIYTGALENHDQLIHSITQRRALWGNSQAVLEKARSPHFVTQLLEDAGLPHPEVFYEYPEESPSDGQWLIKPLKSAGGIGIRHWTPGTKSTRRVYLQEYIEGVPCSAIYVADGGEARLLGVTEQLIGESWAHAGPFRYCGSIGPLMPDKRQWGLLMRIGNVIAAGCGLRGLFGIDFVLADDVPFAVEVNPRYTASVEVIEHTTQTAALALHAHVFDPSYSPSPPRGEGWGEGAKAPATHTPSPLTPLPQGERGDKVIGKAILFAWMSVLFPGEGPWMDSLRNPCDSWDVPAFADIPHPGEAFEVGRPILTFFAKANSVEACKDKLRQIGQELERHLFARS